MSDTLPSETIERGDRFIAYGDETPRRRLYVEVTRVARDRSWADISVRNCYVMWTKRQKLPLPACVPYAWTQTDLDAQDRAWDSADGQSAPAS